MAGKFAMLIPNLAQAATATVTASSEMSASFADSNLLLPRASQKWRSASRFPSDTILEVSPNPYGVSAPMQAFALTGSFTRGSALGRIVYIDGGVTNLPLPAYDEIVAGTIESQSGNFGGPGVVGDINNGIETPDGSAIAFGGSTTAHLHVRFGAAPGNPPVTGARKQAFGILVSMNSLGGGRRPIAVELYQNGVLLADLGTKWVTDEEEDVILLFPWNAAELDDASGDRVEVYITMNDANLSFGTILIEEVSWLIEDETHINLVGSNQYDSGWFEVQQGITGHYAVNPVIVRTGPLLHLHTSGLVDEVAAFTLFIRDDGVPFDTQNEFGPYFMSAPPLYVDGYNIAFGPWWTPAVEQAHGEYVRLDPMDEVIMTDGGGLGGTKRKPVVGIKVSLPFLTPREFGLLMEAYDAMSTLTPFYVSMAPGHESDVWAEGWFCFAGPISGGRKPSAPAPTNYTHAAEITLREMR